MVVSRIGFPIFKNIFVENVGAGETAIAAYVATPPANAEFYYEYSSVRNSDFSYATLGTVNKKAAPCEERPVKNNAEYRARVSILNVKHLRARSMANFLECQHLLVFCPLYNMHTAPGHV